MMNPRLENILVDCLHDTLNLMVCASNVALAASIERALQKYRFFNLFQVRTPADLQPLLNQVNPWHTIVVDSGDVHMREYCAACMQHAHWLPVIMLHHGTTDEAVAVSCVDGAVLHQAGEAAGGSIVVQAPIMSTSSLITLIQVWSLTRMLFTNPPHGLAREAVTALFEHNPFTVAAWATALQTTQRKFQRQCKAYTNLSPKKLLALYHAYRIAFSLVDGVAVPPRRSVIPAYVLDDHSRERIMEYVLTRRSSLFISRN